MSAPRESFHRHKRCWDLAADSALTFAELRFLQCRCQEPGHRARGQAWADGFEELPTTTGNVWSILELTLKGQGRDGAMPHTALPRAGTSPAERGYWRERRGPDRPPRNLPSGVLPMDKGRRRQAMPW